MKRRNVLGKTAVVLLLLVAAAGQFAVPAKSQSGGEALYKAKCAACHGADGKGETTIGKANKLRDFASPDVQKQSDEELNGIITTGKGKMPAYGKSLKTDQIKDLVGYLRSFKK